MAKQVLGILITGFAYYLLIKINKYDVNKLFKIYLRIALIVAIIGIFQEFSFLVGFKAGYDYSYLIPKWWLAKTTFGMLRVNSIFMEPSHFAFAMAPALFVSLITISKNNSFYLSKKTSILLIISVILTFSAVAYIAILISLFLIYFKVKKPRYLLLAVILIPVCIYTAYRYVPDIRMRFDDTLRVATGAKQPGEVNLSTYALASNALVAYKSFVSNPLFGRGLGSHPVSYDKEFPYSGILGGFGQEYAPIVNKEDANSLFLRLASETGLFGMIVVLCFVFKFRLKNRGNENISIISNAIFTMFMIQLLRQGHYFYNGLFFFVWLYYFAYKIHNSKIRKSKNQEHIHA
ncbi:MAG: O-antigen ligase family protein [Candidatus Ratteibacteria bacterium]|jgi:hypothetical protein